MPAGPPDQPAKTGTQAAVPAVAATTDTAAGTMATRRPPSGRRTGIGLAHGIRKVDGGGAVTRASCDVSRFCDRIPAGREGLY